jgi:membrane protein
LCCIPARVEADGRKKGNPLSGEGLGMKVLFKSFIGFFRDNGFLLAGAIAYFFLMSFIPFCLLLVTIFGYFLGGDTAFYAFLSRRLIRFFPAATFQISRELAALVTYRQIGIFTFVVYTYFSYQLFLALETAVHVIFREEAKRSLVVSLVKSLILVSLIVLFFIISFAATSAIQMLKPVITAYTGLKIGIVTGFLIRFVIPVFLVFLISTALYTLLPLKRTALRDALWGGLFMAVFLEAAKHLFTIYIVTTAPQFGAVYGSLSSFVIFLLWVFYSACIFLIGAEIVSALKVSRVRKEKPECTNMKS